MWSCFLLIDRKAENNSTRTCSEMASERASERERGERERDSRSINQNYHHHRLIFFQLFSAFFSQQLMQARKREKKHKLQWQPESERARERDNTSFSCSNKNLIEHDYLSLNETRTALEYIFALPSSLINWRILKYVKRKLSTTTNTNTTNHDQKKVRQRERTLDQVTTTTDERFSRRTAADFRSR